MPRQKTMADTFLDDVKFRKLIRQCDSDLEDRYAAGNKSIDLAHAAGMKYEDALTQAICYGDEGVDDKVRKAEAANDKLRADNTNLRDQLAQVRQSMQTRETELREELDGITEEKAQADRAFETYRLAADAKISAPCENCHGWELAFALQFGLPVWALFAYFAAGDFSITYWLIALLSGLVPLACVEAKWKLRIARRNNPRLDRMVTLGAAVIKTRWAWIKCKLFSKGDEITYGE